MRFFVAAALAVITAVVASAQQPTFRAGARMVTVPTMVTNAEGRLVPGLEKEEFTILDNGKPQELLVFQSEVQPFTAVVTLDFSGSMTANLQLLKAATEQFILRMLPQDKAQVGSFSDKIQFSGSFTNDRDRLIAELSDLQFGNPTRLYDAIDQSITLLEPIEGRKVVVVFTDGDDTASRTGFGTVLERARQHDIMVYSIGLQSEYFNGARMTRTRPARTLRRLAEETGGGFFELTKKDDLASTFTKVAQELHSLYTLGFSPQTLDGKEHKLEVRMKTAGLVARARKSYVADLERAPSAR